MSKLSTKVNLFGTDYACPIFTCPTGGQKSMNPDGELGVARLAIVTPKLGLSLASLLLSEHLSETETLVVRTIRRAYTPLLRWSLANRPIMMLARV